MLIFLKRIRRENGAITIIRGLFPLQMEKMWLSLREKAFSAREVVIIRYYDGYLRLNGAHADGSN